jgi:mannan endo-1,4-beta-mannosidase
MWHGCFPTEGDCCDGNNIWAMENRPDAETWKKMVTEGTELNNAWKEQVDGIAKHLKRLQDEGVPVLWRPYHEMNGVWFWWCNHPGDDGFKKLWIMMFDYLTNHHGLNNLLWVWNTNAPRAIPGDEAFDYVLFYPGGEFLDILAADVYHNDYKQSHHDDIVNLAQGRPVSMGEVGQMPSAETLENQPNWSWFMPWGNLGLKWNDEELIKNLYNSPRVLSLEDLEISKDGKISIVGKIY